MVTAHSGADALTHAIESYLSKDASIATEPFSLQAIALIARGLARAYRDGSDLDAREQTQLGATLAMIAGMNAHMGLCHALIMPLCARYHIPHGRACGMTLPAVLEFNVRTHGAKVAEIFRALGLLATEAALSPLCYEGLRRFFSDLGIDSRLRDYHYRAADRDLIILETLASVQCRYNPTQPTAAEVADILERLI